MSTHTKYDVVIVGGGHAGAALATSLRQRDFAGSILLIGEETTPPYERPPLSKDYLLGKTEKAQLLIRQDTYWNEKSIDLVLGYTAERLNHRQSTITLSDGQRINFDWCVLATGGRAKQIICPGATLSGIHYLRNIVDVERIRFELMKINDVTVIGAGFIGLEFAAVARALGKTVNVIEAQDRILARVTSPVVSKFFEAQHREQGVQFYLNQGVSSFIGNDHISATVLNDGTHIPTQLAVCGIGIDAETTLAEKAGLECDRGVIVDESFRTAAPNVLAIGDCSRHPNIFAGGLWRLESVQHAQDSAAVAAELILGEAIPYSHVPTFWSEQYDIRLQSAGLLGTDYDTVIRGPINGKKFSIIYTRDGKVIAIDCVNSPRDFMAARKLIQNCAQTDQSQLADASIPLRSLV
ncbi:NAD(P)/FAD-dependent oxidoreductase [Hyphococcus sp. DH-69]|uniref:NAD(P)/FAD-dependent oxidoreductase n=1 Tax=Hyphococcus formosus TaxID=3143534 RepID=UPI00398A7749